MFSDKTRYFYIIDKKSNHWGYSGTEEKLAAETPDRYLNVKDVYHIECLNDCFYYVVRSCPVNSQNTIDFDVLPVTYYLYYNNFIFFCARMKTLTGY